MPFANSLGYRLKMFRISRNMRQIDLARLINVRENYLSLIETNRIQPSPGLLQKIAESLEIDVQALINPEDQSEWEKCLKS